MNKIKRRRKESLIKVAISMISSVGMLLLVFILAFVFRQGLGLISIDLIMNDYYSETFNTSFSETIPSTFQRPTDLDADIFFSNQWGIGLADRTDNEGKPIILIEYIDDQSPLRSMLNKANNETITIETGNTISKIIFSNYTILLSSEGAENAIELFDNASGIIDMISSTPGRGIRGSIITTFYLIILTLIIALPLGILSAIYMYEFSKKNTKFIQLLQRMIEMLTGVPSIIFGLLGAAVFIPFVSSVTGATGGNIISGALTLSIIVLPVIISSTKEALQAIPEEYRAASLALGATKTQTVFRVILKSAIPGILSGVLLSIGRIIGESAALIYAVGTAIKDEVILTERSTSLAVHIWSVMAGESPNFELASAIAIIILIMVFLLNIIVKIIAKKMTFKGVNS